MRYLFLLFAVLPYMLPGMLTANTFTQGVEDSVKTAENEVGDKLAVWVIKKDSHFVVQGAFFSEGNWSKAVALSHIDNQGTSPCVAVNNQGIGIASWIEQEGKSYLVKASIYDGRQWQFPVTLSQANPSSTPCVNINIKGDACIIWSSLKPDNTLQASLFFRGKWSHPQTLSGGESVQDHHVVISDAGIAIALWQEFDGKNTVISSSTFAAGQWNRRQVLSAKGCDSSNPLLSLNQLGDGVAVWKSPDKTGIHHFHVANFSPAIGWSAPQDIWPKRQSRNLSRK